MTKVIFGFGLLLAGAPSYADTVLKLEGDSAKTFYDAMSAGEMFDGSLNNTKYIPGKLRCAEKKQFDAPYSYWCEFGSYFRIEGDHAREAFSAYCVTPLEISVYDSFKEGFGTFICTVKSQKDVPAEYSCHFDI